MSYIHISVNIAVEGHCTYSQSQKYIISLCFKALPVKRFIHVLVWCALFLSLYDPASILTGLRNITKYKTPPPQSVENQQLADDLNVFYCRFEKARLIPSSRSDLHFTHSPTHPPPPLPPPPPPWPPSLQRSSTDLWSCAKFPAASNAPPSSLYTKSPKSLALTITDLSLLMSVVMKSLERSSWDITRPLLDLLQFAYRANRSVDDAVNMGLHYILQHLNKPGNYTKILFVHFSSAFNTIMPDLLSDKLTQLSVPTSICQWITGFLTDR